jgi:hypothetical protein
MVTHPFEFEGKKAKVTEEILPERGYKRREKQFFWHLPRAVQAMYDETVAAYDRELTMLATVGLRALLETVIAKKLGKSKCGPNLESKINALSGLFRANTIKTLHEFRVMGNKAVHSQIPPARLDIHHALNVVEAVMEYFYGIDEHVRMFHVLKDKKPKRTRSKGNQNLTAAGAKAGCSPPCGQ